MVAAVSELRGRGILANREPFVKSLGEEFLPELEELPQTKEAIPPLVFSPTFPRS